MIFTRYYVTMKTKKRAKSGPKPIQDKFTKLHISRQRKYQLRKKAAGLCTRCGKRKLVSPNLCGECLRKSGVEHPGRNSRGR